MSITVSGIRKLIRKHYPSAEFVSGDIQRVIFRIDQGLFSVSLNLVVDHAKFGGWIKSEVSEHIQQIFKQDTDFQYPEDLKINLSRKITFSGKTKSNIMVHVTQISDNPLEYHIQAVTHHTDVVTGKITLNRFDDPMDCYVEQFLEDNKEALMGDKNVR